VYIRNVKMHGKDSASVPGRGRPIPDWR
jgi:hypothetical protein